MEALGKLFVGLLLIAIFACLMAVPVYFLWNWLMPIIFKLPVLTFWQALGVSALSSCLFKSSGSSKSKE